MPFTNLQYQCGLDPAVLQAAFNKYKYNQIHHISFIYVVPVIPKQSCKHVLLMRNAAHGSVLTKDKVFQARFGDKVLYLFIAESISLTYHVAKQDPLTVGTKTMNLFMHFLKDCMPHLICHPAWGIMLNILDWIG